MAAAGEAVGAGLGTVRAGEGGTADGAYYELRSYELRIGDQKTALDGFLRDAEVAEAVALGGAARLKPSGAAFPWRTWLLWAVLLLGVAILGGMAWRLSRQIGRP